MNADQKTAAAGSARSSRWHSRLRIGLVLGLFAAVCVILFVLFTSAPEKDLVWLDTNQLARTGRPSLLLKLRYKLSAWASPVIRRIRKSPTQINVTVKVISLSVEELRSSESASTNLDGTSLRILSPDEFQALSSSKSSTNPVVAALSVTTVNGYRAQIASGGSPAQGASPATPSCVLDVRPKIVRQQIKITAGVTLTEFVPVPGRTVLDVQTNIYAAFRAAAPNKGAILLLSGKTNAAGGAYGLLISPAAIDSSGNLIKL